MSASCEEVSPPQCSKNDALSSEVNSGAPPFLRPESSLTLDEKPAPPVIDPSSSSSKDNTNVICKKPVRGPPPSIFSNGCLDVGASLLSRYLRVQRSVKRASATTFLARINDKITLRVSCFRSQSNHFTYRSKARSNKTSSRQRRSLSQPLMAALRFPVSIARLSNVPLFAMTKHVVPFAIAASSASSREKLSLKSVRSPRKRPLTEASSPDNKRHKSSYPRSCPSAAEPRLVDSLEDASRRVPVPQPEPTACSRVSSVSSVSTPHSATNMLYQNAAGGTLPGAERHLLTVPVATAQDVPVNSDVQLCVHSECSDATPPTSVPPSVAMGAPCSPCPMRAAIRDTSSHAPASPAPPALTAGVTAGANAAILPSPSLEPRDVESAAAVCARADTPPSINMPGTPPPLVRAASPLPALPDLPAVSFPLPGDLAPVWSASSSHVLGDAETQCAMPRRRTAHATDVVLAAPSFSCAGGHWLASTLGSTCQAPSCVPPVHPRIPACPTEAITETPLVFSRPAAVTRVSAAVRDSPSAPRGRGRRGPVGRPPAKAKSPPTEAATLLAATPATQLSAASATGDRAEDEGEGEGAEGAGLERVRELDADFLHAVLRASQLPPSALTLRALVEVMRHADMSARVLGAICASVNALNRPLPDAQVHVGVFLDVQPLLLSLVRVAEENEQWDAWNAVRVHLDSRRLRLDELPEQPVHTARSRRRAAGGEKDRVKRGDLTMCAAVVSPQRHEGLMGMITSSGHGFYALLMPDGAELMLRAAEFAVFDVGNTEHVRAATAAQCVLLNKGILPHSTLRSPNCPAATQTAFASLCALLMFAAPHVSTPHSSLLWRITAAARLALAPPPPPFDVTNVALVHRALARTMGVDMPVDELVSSTTPSHSPGAAAASAPPAILNTQTVACTVPALSLAPPASVRGGVRSDIPRQPARTAPDTSTHQSHASQTRVTVAASTANAPLSSPMTARALTPTARMSSVSTLTLPHGVAAAPPPTLSGESSLMHTLVAIRDHQDVPATVSPPATHAFAHTKPFLAAAPSTVSRHGASLPRSDRSLTPFTSTPSVLNGAALALQRAPTLTLTLQALGAPARGANVRAGMSNAEMGLAVGHRSGLPPPLTPAGLHGVRHFYPYPPMHSLNYLHPLLHGSSLATSSFPLLGGGSTRPTESSFALPRARPALSPSTLPSLTTSLTTGLRSPVAHTAPLVRSSSVMDASRQATMGPPPLARNPHSSKHN